MRIGKIPIEAIQDVDTIRYVKERRIMVIIGGP